MAKESGDNRCSKWEGDPFSVNGVRREYRELPEDRKNLIKGLTKRVGSEMWTILKDKSVKQKIDKEVISIQFDHKGVEHVARDALIILSGKYLSHESMLNIHNILENSTYLPTKHTLAHERSDMRTIWYKYQDTDGRGLYFSVAHSPNAQKPYTLYSISDKPPEVEK